MAQKTCSSVIRVNLQIGSGYWEDVSAFVQFNKWGKKVSYSSLLFSLLVSTSMVAGSFQVCCCEKVSVRQGVPERVVSIEIT